MTGTVPHERNIVDKVDESDMSAVENRRPLVVSPAGVRIGDVVQIEVVAATRGGINRLRNRVANLQVQIFAELATQFSLESIVVPLSNVLCQTDSTESGEGSRLVEVWKGSLSCQ